MSLFNWFKKIFTEPAIKQKAEAVVEEDGILMLDMNVLQKYMREAKRELRQKNS